MNQVKEDEFFVHTLEDEASEVEHLLAEPKNDNVSVDGVFCFGEENLKCLEIEGGLDSTSTREGEDELKLGGFDSDEEPSPAKSEDHCVTTIRSEKGGGRRKHHRLWTLSEVIKLIDGVSQCGVGRWTDIKRLLFSSSAYRTSVDLKDKWRNLLRASCAQLQNKKEVEQKQKHALHPLPKSVLRRVSELAIVYPYPRERSCKLSRIGHVTSPILSDSSKGAAFSLGKRIVARKNCT